MAISDLTRGYFNGNEAAVAFIDDFFATCHIWDDLIDKDKPTTDTEINQAFFKAFIVIPRNPFYQANFGTLNPLMEHAFVNWFAANKLEQSKENLDIAYELRNTYLNLIVTCAGIIGGIDWAASVAIDVQKNLHKNDSFEDYVAKLKE